ncbi:hypothetical protein PIB30_021468 [Stylosanthes scabra]|uniref:Uncharacterized protein n=1 Tax=Stylosanthes scabra TaxID=79078 RepID=A0ABU6X6R4_9FABA|nr:hypothetical protein [Stylosanthes scabra]
MGKYAFPRPLAARMGQNVVPSSTWLGGRELVHVAATQPRDPIVLPHDALVRGRRARQQRPDVRRKGEGAASGSRLHAQQGREGVDEEAEYHRQEEISEETETEAEYHRQDDIPEEAETEAEYHRQKDIPGETETEYHGQGDIPEEGHVQTQGGDHA